MNAHEEQCQCACWQEATGALQHRDLGSRSILDSGASLLQANRADWVSRPLFLSYHHHLLPDSLKMVHPMDLEGPESADLLADELDNPFYCPRLPAAVYIDSLRHRIQRPSDAAVNEEDDALIRSFGRLLDQAMFESDLHIHDSHSFAEHGTGSFLAESKSAFSSIPAWEAPNSGTFVALNRPGRTPAFPTNLRAFRDRASSSSPSDESDTDMIDYLCGPVKRLRSSSDTQHYSPVDLNSGAIHLFADEMHSMSSPSDPDAVLHGWPYEQPLKAASTPDKTFVEEPALGKGTS